MKQAGILCPISSLPSKFGIGDLGTNAYKFIDKLKESGISLWQILPLNPLAYGNSPYQPYSSFAGDEIYLDLDLFVKEGLLNKEDIHYYEIESTKVDYIKVRELKTSMYKKAFSHFKDFDKLQDFEKENKWLKGYAIFRVFKAQNDNKEWTLWDDEYKLYPKKQVFNMLPLEKEILYQEFLQYYFSKQWYKLKNYANENNISIIGDMPIYVGLDSADVWLNQENFLLDNDGTPSHVAGVPPDYFSEFGQRWGNPIYDWDYLEKNDFQFWVDRIAHACKLYDTVRIDHFRGFDTFWKIPHSEPTAIIGEWVEAPGYKLFDTLFKKYPNCNILAEDLGELRDEVYTLRDHYKFKGMYVYMFHHHDKFDLDKVVVYSGTHDNDTIVSWYESLEKEDKKLIDKQLKDTKEKEIHHKVIDYLLNLKSETVIIPIWDLLGLDKTCRFNTPGSIGSPNWEWKMTGFDMLDDELSFIKPLIKESKRCK